MMTDHPLTDKDIQSIWDKVGNDIVDAKDEDLDGFVEDALIRTAYDLGANQQLERVVKWIEANPIEDYVWADYTGAIVKEQEFLENFKKAMRPQQQGNSRINDPEVNDRRVRNNRIEIWNGSEWVAQSCFDGLFRQKAMRPQQQENQ